MPPLRGMTGLYDASPASTGQVMDEGVLEARASPLTPDPEHGEYGSQSFGYQGITPWNNPYGPFPSYDGWTYNPDYAELGYNSQGEYDDKTPDIHSAPWPRGIAQPSYDNPDGYAIAGEQLQLLHQQDMGGVEFYQFTAPGGREEETHYTTDRYDAPNENYLSPAPEQLRPGYGYGGGAGGVGNAGGSNADPTQGYGVLNSMEEFHTGHSIRRVQHDHMPWDYTNTHGEQDVPWPGRHPVGQMPLDGPDSPYYEMGNISGAQIPWEGRIKDPTAYQQPAEVTVTVPDYGSDQDIYTWGAM